MISIILILQHLTKWVFLVNNYLFCFTAPKNYRAITVILYLILRSLISGTERSLFIIFVACSLYKKDYTFVGA